MGQSPPLVARPASDAWHVIPSPPPRAAPWAHRFVTRPCRGPAPARCEEHHEHHLVDHSRSPRPPARTIVRLSTPGSPQGEPARSLRAAPWRRPDQVGSPSLRRRVAGTTRQPRRATPRATRAATRRGARRSAFAAAAMTVLGEPTSRRRSSGSGDGIRGDVPRRSHRAPLTIAVELH
ncbi:MAG: hypothetical protein JWP19_2788 [Rhodoglobus sp.]|nr:hypothetical protein [Rhodoglobus sp.]